MLETTLETDVTILLFVSIRHLIQRLYKNQENYPTPFGDTIAI